MYNQIPQLKTGYLLKARDGKFRRVFMDDNSIPKCVQVSVKHRSCIKLSSYRSDFTYPNQPQLDIVQIFAPEIPEALKYESAIHHNLIWTRDELITKYSDADLVNELRNRGWKLEK